MCFTLAKEQLWGKARPLQGNSWNWILNPANIYYLDTATLASSNWTLPRIDLEQTAFHSICTYTILLHKIKVNHHRGRRRTMGRKEWTATFFSYLNGVTHSDNTLHCLWWTQLSKSKWNHQRQSWLVTRTEGSNQLASNHVENDLGNNLQKCY